MHTRLTGLSRLLAIPILFGGASAAPDVGEPLAEAPTLRAVVEYALANHPAIAAQTARWQADTEAIAPASTWHDPHVGVGLTNIGATDWTVGDQPMAQIRIQASQRVPWRGTLARARDVATHAASASQVAVDARRNDVAAAAGRSALGVYRLDRQVAVQRDISEMLRLMVLASEARVSVGAGRQEDLIGLTLEHETLEARIAEAGRRRPALVAAVNAALNRDPGTTLDSIVVAPLSGVPTDAESLIDTTLAAHPDIRRRRAMVRAAEFRVALAERRRISDPTLTAAYGYRADLDGVYSVGIAVPLPVHRDRRQDAAVRASARMAEAARRELEAVERAYVGGTESAAARLAASSELLVAYRERLIPRAHEVLDATYASYATGRTNLISVLDAVRRLHRLRLDAISLDVSSRMGAIELAHATGKAALLATGDMNHE